MRGEQRFTDLPTLAATLAAAIREQLIESIELHGSATLVVPGGPAVEPLFAALRSQRLPWHHVTVTLTDERWVPVDDECSHEGLLRRSLLVDDAAIANLVSFKTAASSPEEAQVEIDAALRALTPFDVVVLGMGDDGHTAALFADAPEIGSGLDLESPDSCLAINPAGGLQPRLSLTLAALLYSRFRYLLLTGEAAWLVYRRALEHGPVEELPVRGVLHPLSRAIQVYWAPAPD